MGTGSYKRQETVHGKAHYITYFRSRASQRAHQPGIISSVTAAPPRMCLLSSTTTFFPAFCKYAACGTGRNVPQRTRVARTDSRTHGNQAIVSSPDYCYVEPPHEGAPASYGECSSTARTGLQHTERHRGKTHNDIICTVCAFQQYIGCTTNLAILICNSRSANNDNMYAACYNAILFWSSGTVGPDDVSNGCPADRAPEGLGAQLQCALHVHAHVPAAVQHTVHLSLQANHTVAW